MSTGRTRPAAIARSLTAGALKALLLTGFALPLLLVVSASLRPNAEAARFAGTLSLHSFVPEAITIDGYVRVGERPIFLLQLLNTVASGLTLATAATVAALLAAYPLARMLFPGRSLLFAMLLATLFVPLDVVIPPLFFVVQTLGLIDSFWGLVLPFIFSPLSIYLLRQAIREVPVELDQAAALDGAGTFRVLLTAIVPNIKASLGAVWLLNFLFVWQWYLWPIIILQSPERQLAQVGIAGLLDPLGGNDYALVFAGTVVALAPALVAFVLLQRFLVQSVAMIGGK